MKQTVFLQSFLIAYMFIGFYLFLFLSMGLNFYFRNTVLKPDSVKTGKPPIVLSTAE